MTLVIFADVSRNYFEYRIITQSMINILPEFDASILSCYLIIAHLSDPPPQNPRKMAKLGKIKKVAKQ